MTQRKITNNYKINGLMLLMALLVIWGCSPTRRLKPNEKLLNKVYVETDNKKISDSEVKGFLRQKPNRKLLGFWRFYLQIYNSVDPVKADSAHARKVRRKESRIEKRETRRNKRCERRKQRTGKDCVPRDKGEAIEAKSFREWVMGIGEAPVIYDSAATPASVDQIKQYLFNMGYFFATVTDSTVAVSAKKVNTYFKIKAGRRYFVGSVTYETPDSTIKKFITESKEEKIPLPARAFSAENIGLERDRITKLLRNKGYYFFTNEFIKVMADTALKNGLCNLVFTIVNPRVPLPGYQDSTIETTHKIYRIRNIIVNTQYVAGRDNYAAYKVNEYKNVDFLYPDSVNLFRPKALYNHIIIKEDSIYSDNRLDYTLTRLGDLRVFKFINVQFNPTDTTADNATLDCYVLLSPSMRRSFGAELQGTNTGGNLGIGGSVSLINKNLFKGAEYFEIKVKGALEAQRLVNKEIDDDGRNALFNTREIGVSVTLNIPSGVFPINYFVKKQYKNPRSQITTAYNYQQRPQYTRNLYSLTFGWSWRQSRRMNITYNPIEVNYIQAVLDTGYANLLKESSPILLSSFQDAFIENGRVSITWTNQQAGKRKNYVFWRMGAESAGLLVNTFAKKEAAYDKIPYDHRIIATVPSAQYARIDFEIYPNIYLNKKNAFAFRAYVGIGSAYLNSKAIPFARAFFSGGSNGMRAWIQRSLGPGKLDKSNSDNQIDQVGDIKIELNAEYRVKLFSFFEAALFVDAGNIWLMTDPDSTRPDGLFSPKFYQQLGVGYGVGLRLDLSFFLLRLDFARRLYDPGAQFFDKTFHSPLNFHTYKPDPDKGSKLQNPIIFNLGIGYPF